VTTGQPTTSHATSQPDRLSGLPVRRARGHSSGPANEALQQTRSAFTTISAALAAERWCSADSLQDGGPDLP